MHHISLWRQLTASLLYRATARDVWERMQVQDAGETLINKLDVLSRLLNIKMKMADEMEDHKANMEKLSSG